MKRLGIITFYCVLGSLFAQEMEVAPVETESGLPQWNEADWDALKNGDLIPGSTIFGEIALERLLSGKQDPIALHPNVREIPDEIPFKEELSTKVNDMFLSRYFHDAPESFLVDPQDLLTGMEKEDREDFLKFHADDSGLDLYVYLFDAKQQIPVGESLNGVILDHFEEKGSAAVIFYFMGDPNRAELSFSENLGEIISRGSKRDLLKLSIEEALEHEEPLAQLEHFSSQLSLRLYWLEKALREEGVLKGLEKGHVLAGDTGEEESFTLALWRDFKGNSEAFYPVVISFCFASAVGLFVLSRYLIDRKRVFVFPDAQGSPLLGAPHAPGVGSIISYANRTQPPSLQRDNFPDYLQRM